jgi:hypothetical protein
MEIIEELVFGRIEQLRIRDGLPCYDPAPRVLQEFKLSSEPERHPDHDTTVVTLKREFERLFDHLNRLSDGMVNIEVRHRLPFRLVLERRYKEIA